MFSRSVPCFLFVALAFASSAAEPPAIQDFARAPVFTNIQISPDGKSVAFLRESGAQTFFCINEIGSEIIYRYRIGTVEAYGAEVQKEVSSFRWISNDRLILTTTVWGSIYGTASMDREGRQWKGLTMYEASVRPPSPMAYETLDTLGGTEDRILMLDRRDFYGAVRLFPHVIEVDAISGGTKMVMKNPGNVIGWTTDHEGNVRLGIARRGTSNSVLYRETPDAEWRTLPLPNRGADKLRALGFDSVDSTFYVAALNDQDRWTVVPFDLEKETPGEPLVSDPVYDIAPDGHTPSFDGKSLTRLFFSESKQKMIGLSYVAEAPRVRWFDEDFRTIQAAVDRALPHTVNLLTGQSRDDNRLLILSFSDRNPGQYHVLDRAARSFIPLAMRMDWIDPAQMSPMLAIKYEARDGLTIHGYLTVPVGHEPRNLPLVVMPHGGPWVRDIWEFDPFVQLLASRGYAVLQMNYRGSPGYGSAFSLAGRKQVGIGIQQDIEDGTKWAIAAGVADPKRVAIIGGSYGGYSALYALGKSPGMYRCGISIAGVSDWLSLFAAGESRPEYRFARQHWEREIGDPSTDEDFLRSISPVHFAEEITAPVLLIHGRDDRTVPIDQAEDMAAALTRAGRQPETRYFGWERHGLSSERSRQAAFEAVIEFLQQHVGPGVEFRGPERRPVGRWGARRPLARPTEPGCSSSAGTRR